MIAVKLRGGQDVEIGIGDSYPPGHIGQHTSKNVPWWRVPGGEWVPCGARSKHRVIEIASISDSIEEFAELQTL